MKNTARGECRVVNTARGEAECCIYHETPPSAVFYIHKHRQCFKWYIVLDPIDTCSSHVVVTAAKKQQQVNWSVLYELIKGITVLYMPNQAHNCTIQYSYAVYYYFMIYAAHFFALIIPRKVQ